MYVLFVDLLLCGIGYFALLYLLCLLCEFLIDMNLHSFLLCVKLSWNGDDEYKNVATKAQY